VKATCRFHEREAWLSALACPVDSNRIYIDVYVVRRRGCRFMRQLAFRCPAFEAFLMTLAA